MSTSLKHKYLVAALVAIHIGLLIVFAFYRTVDGDESFYLSAAYQVAQGKMLYQDFFYPQMPYLPYLLSVFAGYGFFSLFLARLASVVVSLVTMVLFYLVLRRVTDSYIILTAVLSLYVFSGLVIAWHAAAKTYAWTDLLMMGAFYFLTVSAITSKLYPAVIGAAVCMALACNMRLILAPVAVLFLLRALYLSRKNKVLTAAAYIIPSAVITIPTVIILVADVKRFLFNNLGFHFMRHPGSVFLQTLLDRFYILVRTVLDPQVLIILLLLGVAFIHVFLKGRAERPVHSLASISGFALATAVLISLVYLLPYPVHPQYFVQALPFALLAIPAGLKRYIGDQRSENSRRRNMRILLAVLTVYLIGLAPYIAIFIGGVRQIDGYMAVANIRKVSEAVKADEPSGPILFELPIFEVLTEKKGFDGTEYIGWEYPLPLTNEEKKFYRLATYDYLDSILSEKRASHYVVINNPPMELAAATEANYELMDTIDRFKIYRRRP